MKKVISMLLAVIMIAACAISFSACGEKDTDTNETGTGTSAGTSTPVAEGKTNLNFGTGGTTGTYYAYGGVLANIINQNSEKVSVTVISSGASKANIKDVVAGTSDIAVVQNDVMSYAYTGTDLFSEDGAIKGFSTVGALYTEVCQIVASSSIASIEDLKGKAVSVGDAGSGCEFNAKQILAAYGITFDDIKVVNKDFNDSQTALSEGTIDAFFCVAGAPTTAITTLSTTNTINLLSIDDEHVAALRDQYGFYTAYNVEAGTYGIKSDVQTVAVKATLIAADEISEDAIYEVLSQIFGHKDDITAAHEKGNALDLDFAVADMTVPFHKGAVKFFTEKGYTFTEDGLLAD